MCWEGSLLAKTSTTNLHPPYPLPPKESSRDFGELSVPLSVAPEVKPFDIAA